MHRIIFGQITQPVSVNVSLFRELVKNFINYFFSIEKDASVEGEGNPLRG